MHLDDDLHHQTLKELRRTRLEPLKQIGGQVLLRLDVGRLQCLLGRAAVVCFNLLRLFRTLPVYRSKSLIFGKPIQEAEIDRHWRTGEYFPAPCRDLINPTPRTGQDTGLLERRLQNLRFVQAEGSGCGRATGLRPDGKQD